MPLPPDTPIRLSVVVICYNQQKYVAETIKSVLAQTARDRIAEIIVIDDHSSDGSLEIIRKIAAEDPLITVIARETNSGGCALPRNDGIARATGTHIAFLDGDDLWRPDKLERQIEVLERHPQIGLLFTDVTVFDSATGVERLMTVRHYQAEDTDQLSRFFVLGGPIIPSCAVVSQEAIDKVGGFDPGMRFNEDSEFWMRVASVAPLHRIAASLVHKREWFGSLGSAKYGLENLECKRQITRIMLERVPALRAVAGKRESHIEFKTAVHYFTVRDSASARRHLRKALALAPGFGKAWLYLAMSYLSSEPETLLRLGRRARTRVITGLAPTGGRSR